MADDSEWLKLPTEEKCQHKIWKARVAGYEEAKKLFISLDDEKSPEFAKYQGLIKKLVVDSNAVAQEKALEAVLAYVENAHVAGRICAEVISGIVTKCLNASKAKTKELGNEIIMMYIEIDKPDIVQEELLKGVDNKQPKIVVGCIMALTRALREFGSKVIQVKPIVKVLAKLLDDRDKTVREETKQLVIEIYRWVGAAIKPQFSNFKPIQVQEFEAEFEKLPDVKPMQTRFMRSQQDLKSKMESRIAAASSGAGEVADNMPEEEVDPYDLIEPVNILAMLPKDYYEKIEAKKWQERKEALDALLKLSENPKLEPGDYNHLIKTIVKVIGKDTNVMLVTLAGKILANIANGLRKEFKPYANTCFGVIVDKFKEKKLTVVVALRDAIDAVFFSINYESVLEEVVAGLENKNPSIRAEIAGFLARSIAKAVPSVLPKKILKVYCIALVKTINDPVPEVREKSFEALGTAMQLVGEKNIMPFIADVDNLKQIKIKECCEKAVLLLPNGQPRSNQKTVAAPAPAKAVNAPKPVTRPERSKTSADRPQTAPASSKSGPKKKTAASKGKASEKEEHVEAVLTDDAVEEKAAAHLSGEILAQLTSSNWKERLEAMDKFLTVIKGLTKEEIPTQAFIRTLCKKPGLKDNNFQVLNLKFELISQLAQKGIFTKCSAGFCLELMVEKIGDIKNGGACKEALFSIAEVTTLDFVSQEVINAVFSQKNPKNQTEALNWLAQAIKEFGFKVNFKPLNEKVKTALAATNPAIRTAAVHLLGVVYMYMGPTLRVFYENEKSALLQQIDAEFEKVKGEKPPAPIRGVSPSTNDGDDAEGSDNDNDAKGGAVPIEDLIPRTDIGDLITEHILAEMADKNWKVRNEGLQKIIAILNENKFVTPNLGQLPEALKVRLGDSNKNMVNTTLSILQTLANALGPHCKQHIRTVGPGITNCLGDSKVQLRAAALVTLNSWVDKSGLHPLVESEALYDALKLENPNLRSELLGWLSEKLPNVKSLPSELKMCIPLLLTCLEDRNADVRKKANEAVVPFMIHVGYECYFKAAAKAKPASKDALMQILEKARANLPAKPAKAVKAAPQPAKVAAPSATVKKMEVCDDEDDVDMPLPAARPQTAPEGKAKAGKSGVAGRGKGPPSKTSKKKEEEDLSPPLLVTVSKESRMKDEKNLKVLKWNFTEPRGEFVEQLRTQMEKNFSKSLMELLFHSDFKSHIKAIETLAKCLDTQKHETVANLDLILKWLTLRFFDTNPSMLNKALEYLQSIFIILAEDDYHMNDIEAVSFLPYLINKVGDPKDNVRHNVRTILKSVCKVYPGSKLFTYIIDGLKSKNSKQRMECLEECACLIEVYGISVCQPSPAHAMKLISQQISDRDNGVRNAALNTMVTAYMILNDKLFNLTGVLCDKDQSLFDERLKRHMKNRPPSGPKIIKEDKSMKVLPAQQKIAQPMGLIRPGTAGGIPRTSSESPKGTYTLDIEEDVHSQVEMPKLIQLDIDEMYEPVTLPKTRKSPTVKAFLGSSGDMSAQVNFVISQITNRDIDSSIQALCQLDEVLRDPDKSEIFANSIDQLLLAVSMQIKISCSAHMSNEDVSKDDLTRLYKSLLATMMTVFSNKSLGTQASRDVLKDLTNSVITLLLDTRLMDLGEGPQVVRTVNTMVIRIIENSDFTNMLSASIRLLHDSLSSETCTSKFIEMIMKCMWRMVRMLPDSIKDLNIDRILYDAHLFLKAFPTSSWKDKSDLPLRTIKTILHTLTKMKGNKILSHLTLIDSVENSELEAYLLKVLNSGVGPGQDGHMNREETKHKRLSKNSHDVLAEIFKKIGSKENTIQGLNELYDFKEKHPDAELAPYLKKSSEFFQSYIENGMKTIAQERRRGIKKASSSHQSTISNSAPAEEVPPSVYLERLKHLRMMCGLDKTEEGEKVDAPKLSDASNTINQSIEESRQDFDDLPEFNPQVVQSDIRPPSAMVTDVSELKMRLDRIKKNSKV